ncbi:MAG: zinc ribbon domain-containing protein [Bacilli bacterium]|nr:zinc ribbon domain-containing protein [Bacilli bacterium]
MGDYDALGAVIVFFLIFGLVFFVIGLAIYIAVGIFLNKFNKLLYGHGTALAFVPVGNLYLMGKLAFNKAVGYILIGLEIGIPVSNSILSYSGRGEAITALLSLLSSAAGIFNLICLIVAIIKYNNIKKGILSASDVAYQSDQTNIQEAFNNISPNRNNMYNNQANYNQQYNNMQNNMPNGNMPDQNMNNYNNQQMPNNQVTNNNPNVCPSCGSTITETTKFCTHCGTKIRD